jgi:excisionase family DNA binding protein
MSLLRHRLLTTTEAGEILGVNRSTVMRWIAAGIIPAGSIVWSGRRPRIRGAWVEGRQ